MSTISIPFWLVYKTQKALFDVKWVNGEEEGNGSYSEGREKYYMKNPDCYILQFLWKRPKWLLIHILSKITSLSVYFIISHPFKNSCETDYGRTLL